MKIGLFVNGMKVLEYDISDYTQALEDAKIAYEESGVPHEIKFVEA